MLIRKSLHCLSIRVNLDKKGRLTVFLQRDANCLKCSMFSNCRMSHIDQDNLHIEKEKWKQWADVYFEKVINHDIDESDLDESDSDEYEDRKYLVGNTKQQKPTDGFLPVSANETTL